MEFYRIPILALFFTNLLVLGAFSSAHEHNNDDFLECLTDQFENTNAATDTIFTPRNASYASLLQVQNLRHQQTFPLRPLLIITPYYESEIQAAIHCSKKTGLQIRVRSGGHDYEGLSYISSRNPFLIIDMRNFRSISINSEEKTAWVNVGATLGQLYSTIARKSRTLAFPAGICPTVGVGGHFSGGGFGMMARRHSLAADNIIDAKLINADGEILDRRSMGEDLFWAIRGGGGTSFGIVVAFKVKLVTVPETITVFNVSRTLEQNATQLVHRWQYIADNFDANLFVRVYLISLRTPASRNRTIVATFTSLFLGRAHDLVPMMRREFPELGLVEQDCIEMSWIESVLYFASMQNRSLDDLASRTPDGAFGQIYYKGKSDYVSRPIPLTGLRGIWRLLHEEDEYRGELQLSPYGGAINNFSESETPFPHRAGNRLMIHYGVGWEREGNDELQRHVNWIRRLYSYMTPYVTQSPRAAYVNYRDLDLGVDNQGNTSYRQASAWGRRYFKNNFDRLVRVKTQVDPSNFFRNEQSIPSLSSS